MQGLSRAPDCGQQREKKAKEEGGGERWWGWEWAILPMMGM